MKHLYVLLRSAFPRVEAPSGSEGGGAAMDSDDDWGEWHAPRPLMRYTKFVRHGALKFWVYRARVEHIGPPTFAQLMILAADSRSSKCIRMRVRAAVAGPAAERPPPWRAAPQSPRRPPGRGAAAAAAAAKAAAKAVVQSAAAAATAAKAVAPSAAAVAKAA